jgi:hypothetical protein
MHIDIESILELDPSAECKLTFTFTEEWKHCYYQHKNKSNPEIDPNNLPVLDDEYLGDTGEPLCNDNGDEVFDPTQEIEYDLYFPLSETIVYSSKSLIGLIQAKVKELIDSGELIDDFEDYEFIEAIDCEDCSSSGPDAICSFFDKVGCIDEIVIKMENEHDDLLWCTSSKLDEVNGTIDIEILNEDDSKDTNSSNQKESLDGKAIVISGVFEKHSRKELKAIIQEGGGKASSSISKNTSFILAGDKMGPNKKLKAEELNIEMIGEEEFIKKYI